MSLPAGRLRTTPLLIFDGDDTLWNTQELYLAARAKLCEVLARYGLSPALVEEHLETIDLENFDTLGFSPTRFPRSLLDCYRTLLDERSIARSISEERLVLRAGQHVFKKRARPVAGARGVLQSLRPYYRIVLLTKGNPGIQARRVKESGLVDLLDTVRIVDEKTRETFQAILVDEGSGSTASWSIGNSVRSDVNPALEAGMHAILIKAPTWSHETAEPVKTHGLFVVERLSDIREVLL